MATRKDGRTAEQLRAMICELKPLNQADGSARFNFGSTQIISGVFGPREGRASNRDSDESTITVTWNRGAKMSGPREKEYEGIIQKTLEALVVRAQDPLCVIDVTIQEMLESGSSLAAGLNAGVVGLVEAGVALHSLCAAVAVALLPDGTAALDPDSEEEAGAEAVVTVAVRASDGAVLACTCHGAVGEERLLAAVQAAADAAHTVLTLIRQTPAPDLRSLSSSQLAPARAPPPVLALSAG